MRRLCTLLPRAWHTPLETLPGGSLAPGIWDYNMTLPVQVSVVAIGNCATGKTSLLLTFKTGYFPEIFMPAYFETCELEVKLDGSEVVLLKLWDTKGSSDYDRLRPLSYVSNDVAMLCFAFDMPQSLCSITEKWIKEIRYYKPNLPVILVGCKKDLRTTVGVTRRLPEDGDLERPVSVERAMGVAQIIGALHYLECSAKTGEGVDEVFECVAKEGRRSAYRKFIDRPRNKVRCIVM